MAENKDIYKLGQSQKGSIVDSGEEIKIDLQLEDNSIADSGTVFGEIVDNEGNPIEGVTVKITDLDYNPRYHTVTDINGTFTIDEVAANNQYNILSVKEEYNLKQGTPFIMQKGQQLNRDFILQADVNAANSLVAGDILDKNGAAIENVSVFLYDNTNPDQKVLLKTTYTNQFGQYAFFDIVQGIYLIASNKLGYKESETSFVISENEQVRNIILTMEDDPIGRMGTINGIIKDKNNVPVVGAFVILFEVTTDEQGKEVLNPIRRTMTNSEGLYLFEQVPQGDYKIKSNKLKES